MSGPVLMRPETGSPVSVNYVSIVEAIDHAGWSRNEGLFWVPYPVDKSFRVEDTVPDGVFDLLAAELVRRVIGLGFKVHSYNDRTLVARVVGSGREANTEYFGKGENMGKTKNDIVACVKALRIVER